LGGGESGLSCMQLNALAAPVPGNGRPETVCEGLYLSACPVARLKGALLSNRRDNRSLQELRQPPHLAR
jgi:hypothetical protein